jgi:pimeloyl-ACP methyl ester carboxylesterase
MNDLLSNLPLSAPAPVISVSPVVVEAPGRGQALHVRVSAPVSGHALPVLLFSHGNGSSLQGYGPLVQFWAAHGFVVVQPTHLDSRTLGLPADDARRPNIWRHRVAEMRAILDNLATIEAAVPGLAGRLDHTRVAVAGHSYGGQTAGMLLGARLPDPADGQEVNLLDTRVKAGLLLAAPGRGGADLNPATARNYPFLHPDFRYLTTPTLVVVGDHDVSSMSPRGADWRADAYRLSAPEGKCLLTLFGAEHSLGGIAGFESRETTDESPTRIAALQQLSWAYLRSALYPADPAWPVACAALRAQAQPPGQVECR